MTRAMQMLTATLIVAILFVTVVGALYAIEPTMLIQNPIRDAVDSVFGRPHGFIGFWQLGDFFEWMRGIIQDALTS